MQDDRLELAHCIVDAFEREPVVRFAVLQGSLATGTSDEYSDIDITVDVSGTDKGRFAASVPALLGRQLSVLFSDWAHSLLPDKYVRTCFLDGVPIFWNIDIECTATPHVSPPAPITVAPDDHLLKLWVLDAKYLLRGDPVAESRVRHLAAKILPPVDVATAEPGRLMRRVLDELVQRAPPSRTRFLSHCEAVQRRIEAQS